MIIPEKKEESVSKEIQGRVVDEQGEALIGVNVSINGGSGGTITNLNGDFTIRVTKNDFLKVSYIGYTTHMVKISERLFIKLASFTFVIPAAFISCTLYVNALASLLIPNAVTTTSSKAFVSEAIVIL